MIDRSRQLPYSALAEERARELRKNMTIGEAILWRSLKRRAIKGYDFHRQKPIGDYIVDFFCPRLMLAVEIDGESHRGKEEADRERQRRIEALGVTFLRFDDLDARLDDGGVALAIEHWIEEQERMSSFHTPFEPGEPVSKAPLERGRVRVDSEP